MTIDGILRQRRQGSPVAEALTLLPLLVILTLGSFELGRGVWARHTLIHAAREAARYASVRSVKSDDPATEEKIRARAAEAALGIDGSLLVTETTWEPSNTAGATVQVRVRYPFRPITPLLPFDTIELTSNSRHVIVY